MHYVILNGEEYYRNNITIDGFTEVSLHGNDRVDGVFGEITNELLENGYSEQTDGNRFFTEEWLCRDRGVQFVVIKVPQNILYSDNQESIEECFRILDKESFYIELWSIKHKNKEKYEYFIIGYNKNLNFKIIFDEDFTEKEENEIINFICQKIEKKLFKG